MNIFTKRNALVGFVTLKAIEQRRKRKQRRRARMAAAVGLGVLSLGLLAGLAVLLGRKHLGDSSEAEQEQAVSEDDVVAEADAEIAEPNPAT